MIDSPNPLLLAAFAFALTLSLALAACEEVPASEIPENAVASVEEVPASGEAETPERVAQAESLPTEAAGGEAGTAPAAGDEATPQAEHFGAPFSSDAPAISLAEALTTCADTSEPCKVEGTIEAVCQRRGCWFSLAAPDVAQPIRVRMQDYGFFVPTDATGAECTLEGTLTTETIDQETAQHYADEEAGPGETPRQVTGPETIYEFLITGVEIRR